MTAEPLSWADPRRTPRRKRPVDALAVAALLTGPLGGLLPLFGVVLAIVALAGMERRCTRGRRLAIAGLVLGLVSTAGSLAVT